MSIGNIIGCYTDMGLYWSDIIYFYIWGMRLCDFLFCIFYDFDEWFRWTRKSMSFWIMGEYRNALFYWSFCKFLRCDFNGWNLNVVECEMKFYLIIMVIFREFGRSLDFCGFVGCYRYENEGFLIVWKFIFAYGLWVFSKWVPKSIFG